MDSSNYINPPPTARHGLVCDPGTTEDVFLCIMMMHTSVCVCVSVHVCERLFHFSNYIFPCPFPPSLSFSLSLSPCCSYLSSLSLVSHLSPFPFILSQYAPPHLPMSLSAPTHQQHTHSDTRTQTHMHTNSRLGVSPLYMSTSVV